MQHGSSAFHRPIDASGKPIPVSGTANVRAPRGDFLCIWPAIYCGRRLWFATARVPTATIWQTLPQRQRN